jgi:hypothetical protein
MKTRITDPIQDAKNLYASLEEMATSTSLFRSEDYREGLMFARRLIAEVYFPEVLTEDNG